MNTHRWPHFIYHIVDVAGRIRYVGVTQYLDHRWHMHKSEARRAGKGLVSMRPFCAWLLREMNAGREPSMRLVRATSPGRKAAEASEKREIRRQLRMGEPLLNVHC